MLDLPRFAILAYNAENGFWKCVATRNTFDDAVEEFARLRGKGEALHLVTLGFIAAPGTDMGTMNKARTYLGEQA